jgi:NAD+ synthase (glutamine-hydrolysing)
VEKDNLGFFYNSAALLGNGEHLGSYRKVQLVNYRLFDEKRYFKPGSRLPVFETPFGRVGVLICEDVWYPEPARALTFRGAEVILVLNSSPFERGKVELWRNILRQRVYDNMLPMAFVNQAGTQDGVTYWGGSMVISASGDEIARGKILEEDFLICDIDLDESKRLRRRDIRVREVRREILEEVLRAYEEMME